MKKENVEGDAMAAKKPQVKCPGCGLRFIEKMNLTFTSKIDIGILNVTIEKKSKECY